jgi:hypothetical protein
MTKNKTPPRPPTPEEEISTRLLTSEINISALFYQIERITKTLEKLDTAYYEMFPDRLDKDRQVEDQLRALKKFKPGPSSLELLRAAKRDRGTPRKQ